ncbi:MAG: restriction endonuclease subunit S, partial [Mycoplasmoidaceae bacterium]
KTGSQINKNRLSKNNKNNILFPLYNGGVNLSGYHSEFNNLANTIIISQGGESCGHVNYIKTNFFAGAHCFTINNISNLFNKRFLFFYLKSIEESIKNLRKGAGIPGISLYDIKNISIPCPPIEIQNKIVEILDNFEAYVCDLSSGLPLEIDLRKKQYEYYRNKLLTFNNIK